MSYYRPFIINYRFEISDYKNKWRRARCSETNYMPFD